MALCFMSVGIGAFVGRDVGQRHRGACNVEIHAANALEKGAHGLEIALLQQESSASEYLLTGDSAWLGAYRTARADEGRAVDRLHAISGGGTPGAAHIGSGERL